MIHFKNDRIAYHIERQLRRGRSKDGVYSYLSDKNFMPEMRYYIHNLSEYYEKEKQIDYKLETLFNLILEEGVGKLFYNKGKNKSPKFWFNKTDDKNNKFTTLP
jgi:uncharacterized protein (DUF2164 family)